MSQEIVSDGQNSEISIESLKSQVEKVLAKNSELLGEIRAIKDDRNSVQSKISDLIKSHNLDESNPFESLSQRLAQKDNEVKSKMTETEQLKAELGNLNTQVQTLMEIAKSEKEKNIKLSLEKTLDGIFAESNVVSKGRQLLSNYITNGLHRDGEQFYAIDGDNKLDVESYAKRIIKDFPEFIQVNVNSGSGSKSPVKASRSQEIDELISSGKFTNALSQMIGKTK